MKDILIGIVNKIILPTINAPFKFYIPIELENQSTYTSLGAIMCYSMIALYTFKLIWVLAGGGKGDES